MTPLQKRIFDFIRHYVEDNEYSPSLVEIARGIGISPNSISLISRHVHALVRAGMLKFHKQGYRSVQVVKNLSEFSLPLAGYIDSGAFIPAQQTMDLHGMLKQDAHFMLGVKGNAMECEHILDSDFVICKKVLKPCEGDKVLALVNGVATIGHVSWEIPDRITLIPTHNQTKPKAYLLHRVQIQGVLVGVLRWVSGRFLSP